MLSLLRQRNFGLLWWGGLISFIGDWVLFVSLPLFIYQLTGSVAAMGMLFVLNIIPLFLVGSLAGVFVDRWDRKWTLVITNLAVAPMYALLFFFNSPDMLWLVYLVNPLAIMVRQFTGPAENALLPKLVGEEHLVQANALNSLNNNLARLIGPALGGMVFATLGYQAALLIDVSTFVIAGCLIALISASSSITRAEHDPNEPHDAPKSVWGEWLSGLKLVRDNHTLKWLFASVGVNNVIDGIITVLIIVYVQKALGGGSLELGWLMTAQAVGGLLGSAFIGRVGKRVPPWQLLGYGFVLLGIFDLLIFAIPILPLNLTLLVAAGLPIVALEVGAITLFQNATPDRYRGRVMGAYSTTSGLLLMAGRGLATLVGGQVDIVLFLSIVASFYVFAGLIALRKLREPAQQSPVVESKPAEVAA